MARGETQEGLRTRNTIRSSSLTPRGASRDQTMGAHERSGSIRAATFRDSNAMMRNPSTESRGSIKPAAQDELRTSPARRGVESNR